ncbi:MAG: hypothetical protein AB7F25_07200 [Deferribacterales bacterium]
MVETDKGAFFKRKKTIIMLRDTLGSAIKSSSEFGDADRVMILKKIIEDALLGISKKTTKNYMKYVELSNSINELVASVQDIDMLIFCLDKLLIPSCEALDKVPTTEASTIAKSYASSVLKTQGTIGLANILKEWDYITLDICLNRERDIVTELFLLIKNELSNTKIFEFNADKDKNDASVTTAVVQEFERRLGQMRKQRSGKDLESATDFIFNYYGIPCSGAPEHFNVGLEVDNWVKDSSGWYVGFSLKRTLRERWKQTVVDKDTLTSFRIRNIVHLILMDSDLSNNKIAEMGSKRHLFFVSDNSDVLERTKNDSVLKDYVKPFSSLIDYLMQIRE